METRKDGQVRDRGFGGRIWGSLQHSLTHTNYWWALQFFPLNQFRWLWVEALINLGVVGSSPARASERLSGLPSGYWVRCNKPPFPGLRRSICFSDTPRDDDSLDLFQAFFVCDD